MSVNTFISQGRSKEQQITVGEGSTKDELQKTGRWVTINASAAMEIEP